MAPDARIVAPLFAALVLIAAAPVVSAQPLPARAYVEGESYQYELRMQLAEAMRELFAISEHQVVYRNGRAIERIRIIRAFESSAGNLPTPGLGAEPLELSLDPRVRPQPSPTLESLPLQMLTGGLHLIYLAAGPSMGSSQLSRPGDTAEGSAPYIEDRFGSEGPLIERRAAALTFRYVSIDEKEAVLQTTLSAPAKQGWEPHRDWMTSDCAGKPGNFEVVTGVGGNLLAIWGCEQTEVTTHIDVASGKITRADFNLRIRFQKRICSDDDLSDCGEAEDDQQLIKGTLILRPTDPPLPKDRLTVNPRDGLEYAKVPAGTFRLGCVPDDSECYPREHPRHQVTIEQPYWVGRTEVPVKAYETFVKATDRAMPLEPRGIKGFNDHWEKKQHPMVKVTWDDARVYCDWVAGRLPTEAEWEYAARGGQDGLKYPWGNERSHEEANLWRSGGRDTWRHTAPVASFPSNGFGLYDMAGNVYEWTADWYDEEFYKHSPSTNPKGPAGGRFRVARGGAGFINPAVLRLSTRLKDAPDARRLGLGFRCVLDDVP